MSGDVQKHNLIRLFAKHVLSGAPLECEVDPSGSLILITHQHSKVHQGAYYNVNHYFSAVADTATVYVLLKVGANYDAHSVIAVNTSGDAKLEVYEDPVLAGNGTSIGIVNHNRSSSNVADATAFYTPSFNSPPNYGSKLLNGAVLPGGTKDKGGGAIAEAAGEQWVWAKSHNYLVAVTNLSGGAQNISIDIAYYEA